MIIKTASDLKYMHELKQPDSFMFDRKTMKFFGDTMSNFYVPKKAGAAAVTSINTHTRANVQCYTLERRRAVKGGLTAPFYFEIGTLERVRAKA